MTNDEFGAWQDNAVEGYAQDLATAQRVPLDDARRQAQTQFGRLLPDGLDTDSAWLLVVLDGDATRVGTLWLARHPEIPDAAFVFDIEIEQARRGNGFGRAAMLLAEDVVRAAGCTTLHLNVFGFNAPAKRLYDSLGYDVVATQMVKQLPPG
jgi:GNAT superfamily N-acetyltransferase